MQIRIIIILLLVNFILSLNQQCKTDSQCIPNSQCANLYCECNDHFIGYCNISAMYLVHDVKAELKKQQIGYFQVIPEVLNKYIQFSLTVCQPLRSINISLYFWGDEGTIIDFETTKTLIPAQNITLNQGCSSIFTPLISFNHQPSGKSDQLIIGIQTLDQDCTMEITINQQVIFGVSLYKYMIVFAVSFTAFSTFVTLVATIIQKFRRRRMQTVQEGRGENQNLGNNIDHFQIYLPSVKAQTIKSQLSTCCICLQQIQIQEEVRKTPCLHIFHTLCVDSWCKSNMSCPICRKQLDITNLSKRREQKRLSKKDEGREYERQWEQMEEVSVDRGQLEENML